MPISVEDRTRFEASPMRLVGTWWWHLPAPHDPQLLQVTGVNHNGPIFTVRFAAVSYLEGIVIDHATTTDVDWNVLVGEFTSFWHLGDGGWLAVFLHPSQPLTNDALARATLTDVHWETLSVRVAGSDEPGSGWDEELDFYELVHTWRPFIDGVDELRDTEEFETTIRVEIPGYAVETLVKSRFDRLDE